MTNRDDTSGPPHIQFTAEDELTGHVQYEILDVVEGYKKDIVFGAFQGALLHALGIHHNDRKDAVERVFVICCSMARPLVDDDDWLLWRAFARGETDRLD